MQLLSRLTALIIVLARCGAGLAFAVLIAAVLIQVAGRLAGQSPVWSEELTRFALLYMVAFGAGLAFRSGDLVNVDVVCEALPGRAPRFLRLLAAVLTAALAFFLLDYAWRYAQIGRMQTSPALGLRMHFIFFSIWVMLAGLAIFSFLRVIGMLAGTETGAPVKSDEA